MRIKLGQKRGQPALEYMTTYGWALAVVILVLVALYWLGVFSISQDEKCTLNHPFGCQSIKATATDMAIMLRNNGVSDIDVCDVICDARPADAATLLPGTIKPYTNCENDAQRIVSGGVKLVKASDNVDGLSFCTYNGRDAVKEGEPYKGKIYIIYNNAGEGGSTRIATGDVFTVVQP
jgi:hypothetical protein